MKRINISFSSEKDKENFVLQCENDFEKRLMSVSDKVIGSGARIILLTGPTCSGKTTTASRFISAVEAGGGRVGVISIDDFYKFTPSSVKLENYVYNEFKHKMDAIYNLIVNKKYEDLREPSITDFTQIRKKSHLG